MTGGFQSTSDEELRKALDKLNAGMRQVILDMRGIRWTAQSGIDVASEFLPRGQGSSQ